MGKCARMRAAGSKEFMQEVARVREADEGCRQRPLTVVAYSTKKSAAVPLKVAAAPLAKKVAAVPLGDIYSIAAAPLAKKVAAAPLGDIYSLQRQRRWNKK